MNISSKEVSPAETAADFDRFKDLKAFDDTKAGVKGLVDAGIVNIPKIFIRPPDELAEELTFSRSELQIPVIDLSGSGRDNQRREIVDQVKRASEDYGFFLLVNHGIPTSVLESMIDGIRMFHEQDLEVKMQLYSRDRMKRVKFESNIDLYRSQAANWRDTLTVSMVVSDHLEPDEIPDVCREQMFEYINQVSKLGETLFELLSEALGLKQDHLRSMECARGRTFVNHYYPACPEPELTMGVSKHTDPSFLTLLLQDHIGGLQFLHQNQWADVPPLPGSFVVNIGDLLQIISNDKFKSVEHRVLANHIGPRISTACFFTGATVPPRTYAPIRELITEENPILYKEFEVGDYIGKFFSRPIDKSGLEPFKLRSSILSG